MIHREVLSSSYRKVIPHDFENHGPTQKPRETPSVELKPLKKIAITLFPNGNKISSSELTQVTPTTIESFGRPKQAIIVTPLTRAPLTPVFRTSVGGGRIYGGGTSREALRRAKKKSVNLPKSKSKNLSTGNQEFES